jgi:hypothetical protein
MNSYKTKFQNRPARRQLKTALLYVLRPTSTLEQPVWDLLKLLHYYDGHEFDIPTVNGLYFSVISPTGEVLLDTRRSVVQ